MKQTIIKQRINRAAFTMVLITTLLFFCLASPLPGTGAPYTVQVVGAGNTIVNIVQANPIGGDGRAAALQQAINSNMLLLPFVAVINPNGIPGGAAVASATGEGIDFKRFVLARAHMLVTTNWVNASQIELRCFEVSEGRFMFGNRYSLRGGQDGLLDIADKFCDDFLEAVIGSGTFFHSSLAFVRSDGKRKKDIWSMRPNGRHLQRLSNMRGEALSPTWSPDGRRVLFTHIDKRSHGLGMYDFANKTTQRIKFPGNTVIGPAFMPDGRVAVSLTDGRNPSIFLLNQALQKEKRLDNSPAIDVSPSIDAKGSRMAFTSSRLGNPHVFLKDLHSGSVHRISQAGKYNTDPSISPDGTVVVYARMESGGHRIYAQDILTGVEQQITFGPGSDEEPAFAPDGFFIVFMSTRNGQKQLYVTTRKGGQARRLPAGPGDAAFPAWSPPAR